MDFELKLWTEEEEFAILPSISFGFCVFSFGLPQVKPACCSFRTSRSWLGRK